MLILLSSKIHVPDKYSKLKKIDQDKKHYCGVALLAAVTLGCQLAAS